MSSKEFGTVRLRISTGQEVALVTYQGRDISQLEFGFASFIGSSVDYSPRTLETYVSCINSYVKFLYETEDIAHLHIDHAILMAGVYQVNNFLYELRKDEFSSNYIVTIDAALKTFYNWISVNKSYFIHDGEEFKSPYIDNLPKARRAYRRRVRHLTRDEFVTFLNEGIVEEDLKCALHFMFDTGVRISELLRFKVKDFKGLNCNDKPEWVELDVNGSKGPGGFIQDDVLTMSSYVLKRVMDLIQRHSLKDDDFVFVNSRGESLKQNSLQRQFMRISQRMIEKGLRTKTVNAHMLRHGTAFSIMLFSEGPTLEDLIHVKQQLRHRSILSVQSYTSINYVHIKRGREDALEHGLTTRLQESKFIYDSTIGAN
jgi:site-specific recombinase XerD